ncbi:MAG: 4Fe-4S dicluster domain-containing protein [Desulfobacterales bacterium]|nr:4Fe-4S dicluster domain-containing protein [Desulfobacterales bacterium]
MQLGFYINQSRCTGCYTCSVACKDWHDIQAGPVNWRRVIRVEQGRFPFVLVVFNSLSCMHCAEPACVEACPVDAILKRSDNGIVLVDQDACLGNQECGMCYEVCPYDAPQFGEETDAKMEKCSFCVERWREGKKPICVEACPLRALDAGPIDELEAKYGTQKEVEGFTYDPGNKPSVIFKARVPELIQGPIKSR